MNEKNNFTTAIITTCIQSSLARVGTYDSMNISWYLLANWHLK